MRIVSARRRHVPFDRARLALDDGTVVALRLVWPGAGTPAKLADINWFDDLGWVVTILDGRGEALTWYAWALRIT